MYEEAARGEVGRSRTLCRLENQSRVIAKAPANCTRDSFKPDDIGVQLQS